MLLEDSDMGCVEGGWVVRVAVALLPSATLGGGGGGNGFGS
ncbi:hypothetical protein OROGR_009706 [Orobanche gracilis]